MRCRPRRRRQTCSCSTALKVQKTRSYEVGAKANIFREKLALAAAVFQTDIDNARVTSDANTAAFIGRSRIRGVELTANGSILPGWTVFGGYTWLDPVIEDGGFTALTAPAVGAQAAQVVLVPSVNTGKQLPQTTRHSFTATTNVEPVHGFQIGGSALYSARVYGGYADNRTATQTRGGRRHRHPGDQGPVPRRTGLLALRRARQLCGRRASDAQRQRAGPDEQGLFQPGLHQPLRLDRAGPHGVRHRRGAVLMSAPMPFGQDFHPRRSGRNAGRAGTRGADPRGGRRRAGRGAGGAGSSAARRRRGAGRSACRLCVVHAGGRAGASARAQHGRALL